jgi:hypothetical protein
MSNTVMSLRAFARRKGVAHSAVVRAVKTARLHACIRQIDGHPAIVDVGVADHEWEENKQRPRRPRADTKDADLSPFSPVSLTEAQRLLVIERTRKLQIERDVAEGRLVEKAAVAKEAFEAERIVRESFLNLPARLAGELAAETDPVRLQIKLEAAIREALHTAATALERTASE